MEEEAEGNAKITYGGSCQEEFHYFSISSVPEPQGPRYNPAAPGAQGGYAPVKDEVLLGDMAGMQEVNPDVQGEKVTGDVLQAGSPGQSTPTPDSKPTTEDGRTFEDPEDASLRSSDTVIESDLVGQDWPGGHPVCLEEEDGQAATRQEDGPSLPLPLPDPSSPATQESLTLDLSDAETFFDQICHFQSRRMNDQRCSFRKKRRGDDRPWRSVPATPTRLEKRVFFSSTMSLQTEEFFDMVAWAQANRLDDQRAVFLEPPTITLCAPPPGRKKPPEKAERRKSVDARERSDKPVEEKEERRLRKQSRRHSTGATGPPRRTPDEALYSMILTHQSERIEEQRSDPPLPPAAEDLFELLLRVQGGRRMEEQRTELPIGLKQLKVNPC